MIQAVETREFASLHFIMRIEQLQSFKGLNVLVVGDVMLDVYTQGIVERMSPEAPVPVVSKVKSCSRPGGAANVVLNLKELGANPLLCTVIGHDEAGDRLSLLLQEQGISLRTCLFHSDRRTTVKERIYDGDRQLLRVDKEDCHDITDYEKQKLSVIIDDTIQQVDVVVLQDYNKGILEEGFIHFIIEKAKEAGIPVVVDPKKKNFLAYEGCTLFKPNGKELREGLGVEAKSFEELKQAIEQLQSKLRCPYLMTTLSENGVMISFDRRYTSLGPSQGISADFSHYPAFPRHIVDVSGAGDTVLSVAALALASGMSGDDIAQLANLAGGIVCEEKGVVPITYNRLLEEAQLHLL